MVGEKHEYAGSEHGLVVKREAPLSWKLFHQGMFSKAAGILNRMVFLNIKYRCRVVYGEN